MARRRLGVLGSLSGLLMVASLFLPIVRSREVILPQSVSHSTAESFTSLMFAPGGELPLLTAYSLATATAACLLFRPALAYKLAAAWICGVVVFYFVLIRPEFAHDHWLPWGWGSALGGGGLAVFVSLHARRHARPQTDVSAFD
jgi:hypothetical protein